jgi:hypothetical protein
VSLSHTPQTIHKEEGGLCRLRANLYQAVEGAESRIDLVLFTENFDDSADPELGEESWYMDDVIALTPGQAPAALEAIATFIGPPGATFTDPQPAWGAPHMQATAPQINWSCEHSFGAHADPDLVVNVSADTTGSNPTWILCDKWGEEILIDRDAMAWLAHLLPQIQRDYQQSMGEKSELPMEGMA